MGARGGGVLTAHLRGIAAVAGSLALAGCVNVGVTIGEEIPTDRVAEIVPGKTTKEEILRWFGAPADYTDGEVLARLFDVGEIAAEDMVALPFSDLLVYEIDDVDVDIMITLIFNWVRSDLLRDRLVIFFDEHDVVRYYGITRQREKPRAFGVDHQANRIDPVIERQRKK